MSSTASESRPRQQRQDEDSFLARIWPVAQQILLVFVITQLLSKFLQQPSQPQTAVPAAANGNPQDAQLLPPAELHLGWPIGQTLDMHVYLSTSPNGNVFTQWTNGLRKDRDDGLPHFVWEKIIFGDYADHRFVDFEIKFPERVLRNGSLWVDVFLAKDGTHPNPHHPEYDPRNIHHIRKLLTPYMARPKVRKQKNLLSASQEGEQMEPEEPADVIMPHWHKNLTLALVSDASTLQSSGLPPPLAQHVHILQGQRDETGTKGFYKPIIFPNDFWHLKQHYVEVNASYAFAPSTNNLSAHVILEVSDQGASAGAELDEIKRMLLETNPWFLALTATVSLLHVVFEMLAFKSDVSHWRQKKELTGVSDRKQHIQMDRVHRFNSTLPQIVTNVFVQIVILLYLIDNNENTSWMILFGSATGVLIEAWKITKAVDIKLVPAPAGSVLPYKLEVTDKHVLSEDEKKTQEYDKLAFRYVSYVAIPTLAAYTVYSLLYESHKGWYSFTISTLTSFVYMFGFAQLIPQLIINYKLKSVAHMPMKAMIYKTLSTVVDDFFAFCIKMPFLHRLACFRDDAVFLIFLYQRWIYRVDPKRVNEYGQVKEREKDE
ncbi:cleft lip and palate associated transmembrane protein [Amanita rubescens]|nr:cleft lip and palate associated transmembrane protein [Amanita rubescens]